MFIVEVPEREWYDDATATFSTTKKVTFQIEHSLLSISKWESKWQKPFLSKEPMNSEETIDYFKCMTITQNINSDVYNNLPASVHRQIEDYIDNKMTATWFKDNPNMPKNRDTITSEIIYYWMIAHNIPFECQKWHLNRLLTLIRICNDKNQKHPKGNRKQALSDRSALNRARKASLNTKG